MNYFEPPPGRPEGGGANRGSSVVSTHANTYHTSGSPLTQSPSGALITPEWYSQTPQTNLVKHPGQSFSSHKSETHVLAVLPSASNSDGSNNVPELKPRTVVTKAIPPDAVILTQTPVSGSVMPLSVSQIGASDAVNVMVPSTSVSSSLESDATIKNSHNDGSISQFVTMSQAQELHSVTISHASSTVGMTPTGVGQRFMVNAPTSTISKNPVTTIDVTGAPQQLTYLVQQAMQTPTPSSSAGPSTCRPVQQNVNTERPVASNGAGQQGNAHMLQLTSNSQTQSPGDQSYAVVRSRSLMQISDHASQAKPIPKQTNHITQSTPSQSPQQVVPLTPQLQQSTASKPQQTTQQAPQQRIQQQLQHSHMQPQAQTPQSQTSNQQVQVQVQRPPQHQAPTIHLIHSVQPIIQNFQQPTGFQSQVTLQPSQAHPQLQSLQHSQQPQQPSVQFRLLGTPVEDTPTPQASNANPVPEVGERWKHYPDPNVSSDSARNIHEDNPQLQHASNPLSHSQVSQDSQIRIIHPSQHLPSNQYSVTHQPGAAASNPRATAPKQQKKPRQRQTKKQQQQQQQQLQTPQQVLQQPLLQQSHQQQLQAQSQSLIQQQALQQQALQQHPSPQLQQARSSPLQKQQLSQQQSHGMSITNTSNAQPGVVLSAATQRTYSSTPSSVRPATNATVSTMPYHSRVVLSSSVIPQPQHPRSHPNVLTSARSIPATSVTRPNGNSSNFESRHQPHAQTSTAQFSTRLETPTSVNTITSNVSSVNISNPQSLPVSSELSQSDLRNSSTSAQNLPDTIGQSSPQFEDNSNMGSMSSAATPPLLSPASRNTPTPPMSSNAGVTSKKRNVAPLDNEKLAKVNARYENLINDILIKFREEDAIKGDQEDSKESIDNVMITNQETLMQHHNHQYAEYSHPGLTDNQLMPPPPPPPHQMVMHMVNPPSNQVKRVATGPTQPTVPKANANKTKKVQQGLGGKIVPEEANADIVVATPGMSNTGISVHSLENKNGNPRNRKRPPNASKMGGAGGNAKRRKAVGNSLATNSAVATMGRKDKTETNSHEFTLYRRMIEELKSKFPPGESFSDLLCSPRYMGSLSLLPPVGGSNIPDDKINRCLTDDKAWMRGHVSKYASGAFSLPPVPETKPQFNNIDDTRDYWFNRDEKLRTLNVSVDTKIPMGPLLNSPTIIRHQYPGPDTLLEFIPGSPEPLKKKTQCLRLNTNSFDGYSTPPISPRFTEDASIDVEEESCDKVEVKTEPETTPVIEDKVMEVVLTGRPVAVPESAVPRVDVSPKIDSETGEILVDHPPPVAACNAALLSENMAAALDAIQDVNIGPSSIKGASREAGQFKVTVQLSTSQKPYIDQFVEKLIKLFEIDPETAKYDVRITDSPSSVSTDFLGTTQEATRGNNQKTSEEAMAPIDTTKLEKIREDHIRVTDMISSRKRPSICRNCRRSLPLFYFNHRRISELSSGVGHTFKSDPDIEDEFFCDTQCERQFIQKLITHFPPSSASGMMSAGMPGVINILSNISGSLGQEDTSNLAPPQTVDYRHELYVGECSSVVPVVLQGPPPKPGRSLKRSHSHLQQLPGQQQGQFNSNSSQGSVEPPPQKKRMKGIKWKRWSGADQFPRHSYAPPSNEDVIEKLVSLSGCIKPPENVEDDRTCILCHYGKGDEDDEGPGRLLNIDIDRWIHLNCALWLFDVYETQSGSLCDVQPSLLRAKTTVCSHCGKYGAGLPCYRKNCPTVFHLPCALKTNCMFFTDRGMYCHAHRIASHPMHLPSLAVFRRVYISRNEMEQVARVLKDKDVDDITFKQESFESGEIIDWSLSYRLRVGSMILHNVGQLLPHQVESGHFHTNRNIYPVGYTIERYYWSPFAPYERCRYICTIRERPPDNNDGVGYPEFVVTATDSEENKETACGTTCIEAWKPLLKRIASLRQAESLISVYPEHVSGEELFGLTEQHIIRAIESLPGLDILRDYAFKFGGKELIPQMPLAINPTGCARSEPKLRTYVRQSQPVTASGSIMVAGSNNAMANPVSGSSGGSRHSLIHNANVGSYSIPGGASCGGSYGDYTKQYLVTRAQQYRRLKVESRDNVYLSRSRIQGKGLFAAHDLEKNTMVIEYIGEKIRNEVGNRREKLYDAEKRGVYMFRVDDNWIVDATMKGGLARYINHRCTPNCYAEVINVNGEGKIVIVASRKIEKGEELTYDYKFDFEDSSQKIPCNCGSAMCRRWMN